MSLVTQLQNLVVRVGTEFKTVYGKIGNLSSLNTTSKTSLVAAINEITQAVASATNIDDSNSNGSASTVYSSAKLLSLLATLKADILGGASSAYDTLQELATLIQSDQSGIGALVTAIGNKVDFANDQTLTTAQQAKARGNIGAASADDVTTLANNVGDTTSDLVSQFEASLV